MKITADYTGYTGVQYVFEYEDADSFNHLPYELCKQVYSVCLHERKMVIVLHGEKQNWGLVGGSIEQGETFAGTLLREVQEESNMGVVAWLPVGYQKVVDTRDQSFFYQLRTVSIAKPNGPFVSDPAGLISEIKLIDPNDYKQYFDWGEIGDHIIKRALELLPKLEN